MPWKRVDRVVGMLIMVGTITGGCTAPSDMSDEPVPEVSREALELALSADSLDADAAMLRATARLPGFAGLYFESDRVIVRRVGLAAERTASPEARAVLADVGIGTAAEVRERGARFTFAQLYAWKQAVTALAGDLPNAFVDLDEVENAIVVGGVEDQSRAGRILDKLALPEGSLKFVAEDAPIASQLGNLVRPVRGAIGTSFDRVGTFDPVCTVGLTVLMQAGYWYKGFLTNAHCTSTPFGIPSASDTSTYQNAEVSRLNNYIIGREYYDKAPFTGGSCPLFKTCRWADVALVRMYDTVSAVRGTIVRTTFASPPQIAQPGSQTIVPASPFEVTGFLKPIPANVLVNKIGRTTGWTQGYVTRTCVNTGATGHNVFLLCQYRANGYADEGDSGSPVFQTTTGSSATMVGLLWGREGVNFWFSPWQAVLNEMAPKTVSVLWTY